MNWYHADGANLVGSILMILCLLNSLRVRIETITLRCFLILLQIKLIWSLDIFLKLGMKWYENNDQNKRKKLKVFSEPHTNHSLVNLLKIKTKILTDQNHIILQELWQNSNNKKKLQSNGVASLLIIMILKRKNISWNHGMKSNLIRIAI